MGYERNGPRDHGRNYNRDYGRASYPRERDYRSDAGGGRGYQPRDEYRDRDDRRPPSDYHPDDRGFFDRAGDEVRSWFGDEEAERRRRWDERVARREYERRHGPGSYDERYAASAVGFADPMIGGFYPGFESGYGGARSVEHDGRGHDPNYSAWRRRQVEALDRDYEDYRREHQERFDSEFGSWRSTRDTQRRSLQSAQEGQEVVGSDGAHIGEVDHVRGDRILLTKNDKNASGHHHSIPSAWIVKVDDKVVINRTAAQAFAAWKDEEDSNGPHNLNRAFSGTY